MLHGSGHGDIEFAVYPGAVEVLKDVASQEAHLVVVLDCETIDDVLALAALKTLNGIDGDVAERKFAFSCDSVPDGCNLVAVGDYHTDGGVHIKRFLLFLVDMPYKVGND